MKRRRIALLFSLLICATVLLSCTLLLLHASHECHHTECAVCMLLEQRAGKHLSVLRVFAGVWLLGVLGKHCLHVLPENHFFQDFTPVAQKVKLLN